MTDEQQPPTPSTIADFRVTHGAALFDKSHPEHADRVDQLFALTSKVHGETPVGGEGPLPPPNGKPGANLAQGTSIEVAGDNPMRPLTKDDLKDVTGLMSKFRNDLPPLPEGTMWDDITEIQSHMWMEAAGMNRGQASGVLSAYVDMARAGFTPEVAEANRARTQSYVQSLYGDQAEAAFAACNRVISEVGGDKLWDFVEAHGLATHPMFVMQVLQVAQARGYIERR